MSLGAMFLTTTMIASAAFCAVFLFVTPFSTLCVHCAYVYRGGRAIITCMAPNNEITFGTVCILDGRTVKIVLASTNSSSIMPCGISHLAHSGFILKDFSKASAAIVGVTSAISLIDLILRGKFLTRDLAHFSFLSARQEPKQRAIVSLFSSNCAIVVPGAGTSTNPDRICAILSATMLGGKHVLGGLLYGATPFLVVPSIERPVEFVQEVVWATACLNAFPLFYVARTAQLSCFLGFPVAVSSAGAWLVCCIMTFSCLGFGPSFRILSSIRGFGKAHSKIAFTIRLITEWDP